MDKVEFFYLRDEKHVETIKQGKNVSQDVCVEWQSSREIVDVLKFKVLGVDLN